MKLGLIIFGCMMVTFAVCKKDSRKEVENNFSRVKDGLGRLNKTLHSESLINDIVTREIGYYKNRTLRELQLVMNKTNSNKNKKVDQNVCVMAKLLETVEAMFKVLSKAEKTGQIFTDSNIVTTLLNITNDTLIPLTRLTQRCPKRNQSKEPSRTVSHRHCSSMVARLVVRDARRVAAVAAAFFQDSCNVTGNSLKCTGGHIKNLWDNFMEDQNLQNAKTVSFDSLAQYCKREKTANPRNQAKQENRKKNQRGKRQKKN